MKKILAICAVLVLSACDDTEGAMRTVKQAGLTPVSVGGYDFFACSRDDFYHTKFTATNAQGMTVNGVVCRGLMFKASTVRYE